MVELKNPKIFFIPSYCVTLAMACAQSHPYEGYEPASTKEVAEAQEETQINSMEKISSSEMREAQKNSKGAGGGSAGATSSQGARTGGADVEVDTSNAPPVRTPTQTGSQSGFGPSAPSVGAGAPSGGSSGSGGGAPPPAGP